MNSRPGATVGAAKGKVARIVLTVCGLVAIVWAYAALPIFASESTILDVARALVAGEVFKPDVLAAVDDRFATGGSRFRSALLGRVVVIRLRRAVEAIRGDDVALIDRRLESLSHVIHQTLSNAPDDAFAWLIKFWLDSRRDGLRADNFAYLRMSYNLAPYEGWISLTRIPDALTAFPALPPDLADKAVSEFVGLVKWRLDLDAASIAAGPGRPLRGLLFSRLKDLSDDDRRAFATVFYRLELDDVPVPGFAPPTPQIPVPVMPPDL